MVSHVISKRSMIGILIGLGLGWLSVLGVSRIPLTTPAWAQVPDAGAQREQTNRELATLNAKLDELLGLLKSGQLKVLCTLTDNQDSRKDCDDHTQNKQ